MSERITSDDRREVAVILEDPSLPYPYQDGGAFTALDRSDQRRLRQALEALPGCRLEIFERHETLAGELAARRPGFVLNLCDTGLRNHGELEAHVPALLEILEISYSGAAPAGLLVCRDKALVRAAAAVLGVPVPTERLVDGDDGWGEAVAELAYPAIVKPNLEEGSRGITAAAVVDGPPAALARLRALRRELPTGPLLVQEFLGGAEYSVGLIGNPGAGWVELPIFEVDYGGLDAGLPPILAFAYKNDLGSPYARVRYRPTRLAPAAAAELLEHSRRLFARLGCRDYARIDYRADAAGRVKLLEVNPNPAVTWKSCMQQMAADAGHDYPAFLGLLLGAALRRCGKEGPQRHA